MSYCVVADLNLCCVEDVHLGTNQLLHHLFIKSFISLIMKTFDKLVKDELMRTVEADLDPL